MGLVRGEYYDIPEMTIEPHPPSPVPILCGGESGPALRRAARYCDGWVDTAEQYRAPIEDFAERIITQLT
ncbi:LLM class flavin-dependent oxidoreductase [Rhodococcus rhodochrous]|uniref:LLM class flavin-dependent oxidoreductase n=1 Tax=Rhodococcus rhodochrous TaxID=1829 RepID=UPI003B82EE12